MSRAAGSAGTIGRIALGAHALLAVVFFLLPLSVIIGTSFTTTAYLRFPPEGFTLAWYAKFLTDGSYVQSLLLSAVLGLSATLTAAVLGVPVGTVRSRLHRGRKMLQKVLWQVALEAGIVADLAREEREEEGRP